MSKVFSPCFKTARTDQVGLELEEESFCVSRRYKAQEYKAYDFRKGELLRLTRVVYSRELQHSSPNQLQTWNDKLVQVTQRILIQQIMRVVAPPCDTIFEKLALLCDIVDDWFDLDFHCKRSVPLVIPPTF